MKMMWRKTLIILLLLFMVRSAEAQLDGYKYFVVPLQFDGFKNVNQFRTSTLIKHLFTENGFPAVYDDAIPPELASKPCQGLRVGLIDQSTLLNTKVILALKDCYGQTVFETMEGKSKSKDYEIAYREAISEAFVVLAAQGYSYDPEALKDKDAQAAPVAVGTVTASNPGIVEQPKDAAVAAEVAAVGAVAESAAAEEVAETWYAQPIENGYQLVDSSPAIRMKLVKTSQEDTFIAMVDDAPMGMVYKKDGAWWHEFYQDGKATLRKLQIRF